MSFHVVFEHVLCTFTRVRCLVEYIAFGLDRSFVKLSSESLFAQHMPQHFHSIYLPSYFCCGVLRGVDG